MIEVKNNKTNREDEKKTQKATKKVEKFRNKSNCNNYKSPSVCNYFHRFLLFDFFLVWKSKRFEGSSILQVL